MALTIISCLGLVTPALAQQATHDVSPNALTVAPSPPALSEVERLRVENHLLRVLVAQLTAQAQTAALSKERDQLEATVVAGYPGWRMDWQTGQLVPASTATPETPR